MAQTSDPAQSQGPNQSPTVLILSVISAALLAGIIVKSIDKTAPAKEPTLAEKQAELDIRLAKVNRNRQDLGQEPLQGFGSEDAEKIASRLTRDAVQLASYTDVFRTELSKKDQLLEQRGEELLANEQTRNALTSQLSKMQTELDAARLKSSPNEELRIRLEQAESRLIPLKEELALLSSRPSSEELTKAKARILDLEAQLVAIQLATPAPAPATLPQPSKLFAESEADLIPHAHALYRSLSELNDKSDIEINAAYNRFGMQLKASFLKDIRFDTGSSTLKPSDTIAINASLATLPKGAMILVVGYASTTGNADSNRVLSSDRATAVAKNIDFEKPAHTVVQAVFLGQTNRFSSRIPERNQVCEVWAILP